jgi:hypothetical protein
MRTTVVKCKFTKAEDARLLAVISRGTSDDWAQVAREMPGRTPRQCRERWNNYVSPAITWLPWTDSEELTLAQKYRELGPRWAVILRWFPGRAKNQLKNHWLAQQRKAGKTGEQSQFSVNPTIPDEQESSFDADDSTNWSGSRDFGCASD